MRKKIIAGNWKMNMTPTEAVNLVNTRKPLVNNEDAVSYTHLRQDIHRQAELRCL